MVKTRFKNRRFLNGLELFFPNDHRVGFRKQKKTAGWKSSTRGRSGAENFVLLLFFFIPCRQDAILTTQRKFDIKISMVGIDKVKVRFHYLALAHVSHFFSHMLQSVHLR